MPVSAHKEISVKGCHWEVASLYTDAHIIYTIEVTHYEGGEENETKELIAVVCMHVCIPSLSLCMYHHTYIHTNIAMGCRCDPALGV